MISIGTSTFKTHHTGDIKKISDKEIAYRDLVNQINHEFVTKDSNGHNVKHIHSFTIALNHLTADATTNFLARFNELGNFTIRMEIEYRIHKNDTFDDFCVLKYSDVIRFEVINPFVNKFDLYSDTYMSIQKQKIFPLGRKIHLAMAFNSSLDPQLEIKGIRLNPLSSNIALQCQLAFVLDNSIDQFFVSHGTEYIISIDAVISHEYSGNIGKLELLWTDGKLVQFDTELTNSTEFLLPEIDAKRYDINLDYSIPREVLLKKPIEQVISVTNSSDEFKKISFLIDHSPNFVLSGLVKKRLVLYPNETREINISMIPLSYGKLKLPPFKIMEYPLIGSTSDNKINSIYTLPDYIIVKGNY
jgi:hypothetical protein